MRLGQLTLSLLDSYSAVPVVGNAWVKGVDRSRKSSLLGRFFSQVWFDPTQMSYDSALSSRQAP